MNKGFESAPGRNRTSARGLGNGVGCVEAAYKRRTFRRLVAPTDSLSSLTIYAARAYFERVVETGADRFRHRRQG
jgi:hypothetical protein